MALRQYSTPYYDSTVSPAMQPVWAVFVAAFAVRLVLVVYGSWHDSTCTEVLRCRRHSICFTVAMKATTRSELDTVPVV